MSARTPRARAIWAHMAQLACRQMDPAAVEHMVPGPKYRRGGTLAVDNFLGESPARPMPGAASATGMREEIESAFCALERLLERAERDSGSDIDRYRALRDVRRALPDLWQRADAALERDIPLLVSTGTTGYVARGAQIRHQGQRYTHPELLSRVGHTVELQADPGRPERLRVRDPRTGREICIATLAGWAQR